MAKGIYKKDELDAVGQKITRRLIRENPNLAGELLDSVPKEDRARLVMRYPARDRMDLIMLSSDPEGLIEAMAAPDLWLSIKEIGEEDAVELVRLAGADKLRYLFDLECWHKDVLDPLTFAFWLKILADAGPEKLIEWFEESDEDFLVASFSKFFNVYKKDPDDEGFEPWRSFKNLWTQDGVYYLHFKDPFLATVVQSALEAIRSAHDYRYYALLDHVELGMGAEAEEAAYSFRGSRMADHGFLELEEAIYVYAPLSDKDLARLETEAASPRESWFEGPAGAAAAFPLALTDPPTFFGRALSLVEDPEVIEDLALGLGSLVNRVIVADAMDMTKVESVHDALAKSMTFLDLGLKRWSGGDLEKAAHLLRAQHPLYLFRAGYSRVLALGRRAGTLKRSGWPSRYDFGLELLGEDGPVIEGLSKPRPLYYAGAGENGEALFVEFRSGEEIERAERATRRAEFMGLVFFEALGITDRELANLKRAYQGLALNWETVFLTAAARAFSGSGFGFEPLSAQDAGSALEAMLTPGAPREVRPDAARELRSRLTGAVSRLAAAGDEELEMASSLADSCLELLAEEARSICLEELDPRYIEWLVIEG